MKALVLEVVREFEPTLHLVVRARDVGQFVSRHFRSGYFVVDFRMRRMVFSLLSSQSHEIRLLTGQALATASQSANGTLVFNLNGIRYPSIYVSSEVYVAAYILSMTRNHVYDNGEVIIVNLPFWVKRVVLL